MKPSCKIQGNAVVVVLILILLGTGLLLLVNQESGLFTRVAGFFQRSQSIQFQAQSGIELAKVDLTQLTRNALSGDNGSLDTFTQLPEGTVEDTIHQGLQFSQEIERTIEPRITRSQGPINIEVFYFPENPCPLDLTCLSDPTEYDQIVPKYFTIVSQATHTQTQEVFTFEQRVQVRLENFSEISYGITGATDFPVMGPNDFYSFAPTLYGGRVHFNVPENRIKFLAPSLSVSNSEGDLVGSSSVHTFLELATFQHEDKYADPEHNKDYPFKRPSKTYSSGAHEVQVSGHRATLDFKQGWKTEEALVINSEDDGYNPYNDPTSDEFFTELGNSASTYGINLNEQGIFNNNCAPDATGQPVQNICLKMVGGEVRQYDCVELDLTTGGKILNPRVDYVMRPNILNQGLEHPGYGNQTFTHLDLPETYEGERSEVFQGTAAGTNLGDANGVIYCKGTAGCKCNVVVKGIYASQTTVAADRVTIAGDIVNANQDPLYSPYIFGIVAQDDIVVPQGIPQGANTPGYAEIGNAWKDRFVHNLPEARLLTDHYPPFTPSGCTMPNQPCTPGNIAESYLGITNFIPHDGFEYQDRDAGNDLNNFQGNEYYRDYIHWLDHENETEQPYFNAVNALDLDIHAFAGRHFKVDGIFNPELTPEDGMTFLTCENAACSEVSYRTSDELYVIDGDNVSHPLGTDGTPIHPMFWADGRISYTGHNSPSYEEQKYLKPSLSNNMYDLQGSTPSNRYEAIPRPKNSLLHIRGSINSKYFFINQTLGGYTVGFDKRIIQKDPRVGFLAPPGFPNTQRVMFDTLYAKSYLGRSALLP